MKTNKTIVRMAALSALIAQGACQSITAPVQPSQIAHDPFETYKLGTVYDCAAAGAPDIRTNYQNLPTAGFGCSHQSNITLMAANPEDLTTPRPSTPTDPRRVLRVYESYGAGEDTTTARRAQGTQELIE